MAAFETFDLGKALATAEGIKAMRRQSTFDTLREQATRGQISAQDQASQINAAQEQRAVTQFSQEQQVANTRMLNAAAAEVAQDPSPEVIQRWLPQLKQAGVLAPDFDPTQIPAEQLQQSATRLYKSTSAALSALNPPKPGQAEDVVQTIGPDGKPVYTKKSEAPGMTPYIKPDKPDAPKSRFRALTKEEIASSGLPPGSSAQIDEATGKIDVLSKRDATGGLSQKDQTTAKMKLNTVSLARQQLNNIRQRFKPLKNTSSAGPFGQGKLPTEEGRSFDRAVDQMRSTLTALTRVPGVGAMSDYETKLDQAKFPTREEYESVTQQQIDDLDNMLNAIETGYGDLLSGNAAEPEQPQTPQTEVTATGPNGEKIILRNGQWVSAGG